MDKKLRKEAENVNDEWRDSETARLVPVTHLVGDRQKWLLIYTQEVWMITMVMVLCNAALNTGSGLIKEGACVKSRTDPAAS